MVSTIQYDAMVRMLRTAAAEIRTNHELLSKLDSVGGDGDHGTTMVRAMSYLEKAIANHTAGDIQTLLYDVGWAILGVDGGATGPLLGTFFMSMSDAMEDRDQITAPQLAALLAVALAGICVQTPARPGDKTLVDSLTPAVDAAKAAAEAGGDIMEVLRAAAEGAEKGAAATKAMQARFGRARNIKEQSIGTQDPGATSMALIFQGFWKGINGHA